MKNTLNVKVLYHFYHSAVKAELKRRGFSKDVSGKINEEHKKIIGRAKEIGKSRLLSSYIMATYFIANEPEYLESRLRKIMRYFVTDCAHRSYSTRQSGMWSII